MRSLALRYAFCRSLALTLVPRFSVAARSFSSRFVVRTRCIPTSKCMCGHFRECACVFVRTDMNACVCVCAWAYLYKCYLVVAHHFFFTTMFAASFRFILFHSSLFVFLSIYFGLILVCFFFLFLFHSQVSYSQYITYCEISNNLLQLSNLDKINLMFVVLIKQE